VKHCYGHNGNESVPPPIILKLMLLLFFYNFRSERELMETVPERMDWLWFLGYDPSLVGCSPTRWITRPCPAALEVRPLLLFPSSRCLPYSLLKII
jgi:hypothetical protein